MDALRAQRRRAALFTGRSRTTTLCRSAAGLRAGGWGNSNVLQVDFQMPVFTADSASPRMKIVGLDDYCYGGPDCDEVPAEMPVPDGGLGTA